MGIVFSKLREFIRGKVDDFKQCVRNKVENTKNSIRNRVTAAKDNVCDKVVGAKDAVVTKIVDTKDAACTRVNNAVTSVVVAAKTTRDDVVCSICNRVRCVCDRIIAVRDRIHAAVVSTKNAVTSRVNAAVASVVRAKDATVDYSQRTKNAAVERYCNSRDAVYSRYYSIRNAKLTKWQKVKYGLLAVVILFILSVILLTLLDLYLEDYVSAKYRLAVIWWFICTTCQFLWDVSIVGATYTWCVIQFAAATVWQGSKVAADYGLVGAKMAGKQICAGTVVAAQYATSGSKIAAKHSAEYGTMVARYTWIGCKHGAICGYHLMLGLADYALLLSRLCWEYAYAAAAVGSLYVAEGGKLGAQYAATGCVYAYEHGTTAAKHGSICFYHYAIYFVTNFRKASAEAAVWLWATLQAVVVATCSAAYSGGRSLLCWTADLVHKSYELVLLTGQLLYSLSISVVSWTTIIVTNVVIFVKEFATAAITFIISASVTAYNATITTVQAFYNGSISFSEWSVSTAKVTWSWFTTAVVGISNFLYVAVTEYGFHWAEAIGSTLLDVTLFLGRVLCKFFGDLGAYVANFFYVTLSRILSLAYIIISFVYTIAVAIASVIRTVLDIAVFCTTRMFGAIIWFLRETLFAYMYMLHQYNIYRELLFLIFIGLLTVYCTGLMRDRRRLNEPDDGDSSDGGSDEDVGDTRTPEFGQLETQKKQKKGSTSADKQPIMPSHEEVDDDLSDIELPEKIEDVEDRELEEEDLVPAEEHEVVEG